jgi:hypothetical protein
MIQKKAKNPLKNFYLIQIILPLIILILMMMNLAQMNHMMIIRILIELREEKIKNIISKMIILVIHQKESMGAITKKKKEMKKL